MNLLSRIVIINYFFTITIYFTLFYSALCQHLKAHEDTGLTLVELIVKHGYPVQVFEDIETEDGYLLTMIRIPYGKINNERFKKRPVVFIMHGVLSSAADFAMMGPEQGLAYFLAEKGYDVFLGNARGNKFSKKHKTLNPEKDKRKYWDFSWHEIGLYDVPAMIDFALEITNSQELFYIGHSQGTTAFFVMASERPEYNDKIKLAIALCPIVFMQNIQNTFLKLVANLQGVGTILSHLIGLYEFLPHDDLYQELGTTLCEEDFPQEIICDTIVSLLLGPSNSTNKELLPLVLSHVPAGASTKQLIHYGQEINSGNFQQFDYGSLLGNFLRYNQTTPPKYNLSNVNAEILLVYGSKDTLTDEIDIYKLAKQLKNLISITKIEGYGHGDFAWNKNAPTVLYDQLVKLMEMKL